MCMDFISDYKRVPLDFYILCHCIFQNYICDVQTNVELRAK